MENAINDSAVKPIVEQTKTEPEAVETISKADLQALLDKQNKEWQSRFDKVLTEKKTVEGKATTVEQRLELIEQERQTERIDWSRKEAKAKAQIDDELEAALLDYSSRDPEKIHGGATKIRSIIDNLIATNSDLKVKAALEKAGAQPKPTGGTPPMPANTLEALEAKYAEAVEKNNGDAMMYYKDQIAKLKKRG